MNTRNLILAICLIFVGLTSCQKEEVADLVSANTNNYTANQANKASIYPCVKDSDAVYISYLGNHAETVTVFNALVNPNTTTTGVYAHLSDTFWQFDIPNQSSDLTATGATFTVRSSENYVVNASIPYSDNKTDYMNGVVTGYIEMCFGYRHKSPIVVCRESVVDACIGGPGVNFGIIVLLEGSGG